MRDCVLDVRRSGAAVEHSVYDTAPALSYHTYNYYLRAFEPWVRVERPDPSELRRRLLEPADESPVLISDPDYLGIALPLQEQSGRLVNAFRADPGLVILLPGRYGACLAPAVRAGGKAVLWPAAAKGSP
jgi:hypothetical protein